MGWTGNPPMSVDVSRLLRHMQGKRGFAPTVRQCERHISQAQGGGLEIE